MLGGQWDADSFANKSAQCVLALLLIESRSPDFEGKTVCTMNMVLGGWYLCMRMGEGRGTGLSVLWSWWLPSFCRHYRLTWKHIRYLIRMASWKKLLIRIHILTSNKMFTTFMCLYLPLRRPFLPQCAWCWAFWAKREGKHTGWIPVLFWFHP